MKTIIVIGAGFSGILVMKKLMHVLPPSQFRFVIISPKDYFLFTPLLVDLFNAPQEKEQAIARIQDTFKGQRNVTIIKERARLVNLGAKQVHTKARRISYDILVFAHGATTNFFAVNGAARYCLTYKEFEDVERIKRSIKSAFQKAKKARGKQREMLLTTAVIGAGATGVEIVFEIQPFAQQLAEQQGIDPQEVRVVLIISGDKPVPHFDARFAPKATAALQQKGIDLRFNTRVVAVKKDAIITKQSTIPAATKVWTAGIATNLLKIAPAISPPGNQIPVNSHLCVNGYPNVFAVGDCCAMEGKSIPRTAQAAIALAEHAAKNIQKMIKGAPLVSFSFTPRGEMLLLGDRALMRAYAFIVDGAMANWFRRTYYHRSFKRYS